MRQENFPPHFRCDYPSTSGSPATEVSRERIPARTEAEATAIQFTSPMNADVPTVATAVCATVFTARTPAAFSHFLKLFFIKIPPKVF